MWHGESAPELALGKCDGQHDTGIDARYVVHPYRGEDAGALSPTAIPLPLRAAGVIAANVASLALATWLV